jgi:hypothetical protein
MKVLSRPLNIILSLILAACTPMEAVHKDGEKTPDFPGLSIQNLPFSQQKFRLDSVLAINRSLADAATASEMAYEDKASDGWERFEISKTSDENKIEKIVILLRIDNKKRLVEIAIRGTANFDDVIDDLNKRAVRDETLDILLHSGFRNLAVQVHTFLQEKIPPAAFKEYRFQLYGHSLGGAVAAIVSMYLHQAGTNVSLVATFGAPRFTTNEGARKYQVLNANTYRVVRCDDVVPFLPPPNFFGWSTESYQANGNILLLLAPPYFDYSVGIDIERDFVYQLRSELQNVSEREKLAFGHRMKNYDDLVQNITPTGLSMEKTLKPISYNFSLQKQLCPAKLTCVDFRPKQ